MDSLIDGSKSHIGEKQGRHAVLPRALIRMAALLCSIALAPICWAGSQIDTHRYGVYSLPSADRPPLHTGGPLRVPVKALIERLALGADRFTTQKRRFRYDVDALGQGLNLRVKLNF